MEDDSVFFISDGGRITSNPLLDQLPSYQSLLYRRKSSSVKSRGSWKGRLSISSRMNTVNRLEERQKSQMEQRAIRELPLPMADKRRHKDQRKEERKDLSSCRQWRAGARRYMKRLTDDAHAFLSSMKLWRADIHQIEGMFGTGILSYFSFLRFLVALNLIVFLVMFCFVMLPMIIDPQPSRNVTYNENQGNVCSTYPSTTRKILINYHEHIRDLLSGEGILERTYLLYGFYKKDEIRFPKFIYKLPLAYLLATLGYLLLSLLWIVKRSAEGFKRHLIKDEDRFQSFCNKIFAGWDFCITSESAANQKRNSLLYELKTDLEDERIKQKMADRTRQDKCRIYLLRVILNMFVIGVLAACFFSIYVATTFSQKEGKKNKKVNFMVDLIHEYLPSIVITLANFITPLLFSVIINYEDYSPAFEIRFTLMRCVFMRLTSIVVLLFSLWSQLNDCGTDPCGNQKLCPCWETRVGQEMYKLTIFDFIIILAVTIFVEFPRKMLVNFCACPLAKMWGQQEFSIPQNVLEIVYGQTICWIGTFYCPMLPAICTIKYFCIFYIKKLSLIRNCRPATRPFRASSSNFFFLGVLLIGLILACLPISISLAQIKSSQACGPFFRYNTSWEALPDAVEALPQNAKTFIHLLASETFAVSFFVVTCLAMFYVIALAGAHKKVINQLREKLVMEGQDKRFLIRKLCQAQNVRGVKSTPRLCSPSRRSPSYHTSFSSNFSEAVVLAHSPPKSSTHV
ncbi:transmembrane channel-like protein 7 [Gambusia affinis]|uniref:transmembrane channel-like protein 7 n=1 Tax=Gambusia affinis TaxID=33528 RepID=UPI001CDD6D79|nr:transmembrane channel-like protein 7 [Gambusia affinis]